MNKLKPREGEEKAGIGAHQEGKTKIFKKRKRYVKGKKGERKKRARAEVKQK